MSGGYKRYLLFILAIVLAFNLVDRLALGLVLQSVKADLGLNDTQLGFLTGIAFAFFYATMGIPLARWADRGNRIALISITTALWSVAVALCGAVNSFLQMLTVRIAVAVGEAGTMPAAQSLIADHFERARRPKATAVFMLGGPLGVIIGYMAAGWLDQMFGWRMMFVLLALPGLVLAVLVGLTLREPRTLVRGGGQRVEHEQTISVCIDLLRGRSFRHLLIGFSVLQFFNYGILQWQPTFFIRTHDLGTGTLGAWFGLIYGVGGLIGTHLGGEIASRWASRDERLQLRVVAAAFVLFGVAKALLFIVPDYHAALAFLSFAVVGGAMANAPLFATLQTLVPENRRATAVALILFSANLIGMGLGPVAIGVLSDWLMPSLGGDSLRYALALLCPGFLWSALHVWLAGRTIRVEIENVDGSRDL